MMGDASSAEPTAGAAGAAGEDDAVAAAALLAGRRWCFSAYLQHETEKADHSHSAFTLARDREMDKSEDKSKAKCTATRHGNAIQLLT